MAFLVKTKSSKTLKAPIQCDMHRFEHNALFQKFMAEFPYKISYLKELSEKVVREIRKGYKHNLVSSLGGVSEVSDFKCLDSCITSLPTGEERGVSYGAGFYGECIRIIRMEFLGGGAYETSTLEHSVMHKDIVHKRGLLDRDCPATEFWSVFADCIGRLAKRHNDDHKLKVGICFPFPVYMKDIKNVTVVTLCKEFETGMNTNDPLIGNNCVLMLRYALQKQKIDAEVYGSINDTVGALLNASYKSGEYPALPPVRIGLIAGMGFNVCLLDEQAQDYGYHGTLINLEAASLRTQDHNVDIRVVCNSKGKGLHTGEKKVASKYLPEVIRFALLHILQSTAPPKMYLTEGLSIEQCALIYDNYKSEEVHEVIRTVMSDAFDWTPETPEMIYMISELIEAVWNRSAAIVAAVMAGTAEHTGRLRPALGGVTVGIGGSLYTKNKRFQARLRKYLRAILGEKHKLIHILISKDGSTKGAALLSCCDTYSLD